jgi:nitrous oxide reductase accessory protein NosL
VGKKNSGSPLLIGIAIVIGLLAAIPKQVWIAMAALAAVGFLVWQFMKRAKTTTASSEAGASSTQSNQQDAAVPVKQTLGAKGAVVPARQASARTTEVSSPSSEFSAQRSAAPAAAFTSTAKQLVFTAKPTEPEALVTITVTGASPEKEYGIPAAPTGWLGKAQWVQPGQRITVAGFELTDGMIYVGAGLRTGSQDIDPALINPNLKVASVEVDWSLPLTDYWPNYSTI